MIIVRKELAGFLIPLISTLLCAQKSGAQYLKDIAPFPIGTAISKDIYTDPLGNPIVVNEFSRLTPEFQMKIGTTNPNSKTSYNFTAADEVVDFANANNKKVHGHTLIYPIGSSSYTNWMRDMITRADSVEWENYMKSRIETMINRYKAKGVKVWDVVNEAFLDNGNLHVDPVPGLISKENIWAKMLGPDYIARAFQYAHQADPEALLFYNDFGHEYAPSKTNAIIAMVNDFKNRGIPIHGLGLQMHTHVAVSKTSLENAIQSLASTGLLIHISEATIEINRASQQAKPIAQRLQEQKQKYRELVEAMRLIPIPQRYGFSLWGVTDKKSYPARPTLDWPVLWDDDFVKKPAYDGVVEGLQTLLTIMQVDCKSFVASSKKNGIQLNWQSVNENDSNKNYQLFRSTNGTDYTLLAKIPTTNILAGNSYTYTDTDVNIGFSYYYQLKLEDKNGSTKPFCNIVKFTWQGLNEPALKVYPNPAKDKINLQLNSGNSGTLTVQLFNITGAMVYNKTIRNSNNNIEINTTKLANGNYFIKLKKGAETLTERFVKQN